MHQSLATLLFLALSSLAACHQPPSTTDSTLQASSKSARSEYHHHSPPHLFEHHYPHHFGGGHHMGHHYKEYENYLMPVLLVLGLGVLVMPLLSVLMTTMVGNVPVTTLVSGRRKREVDTPKETLLGGLDDVFRKLGKAVEVFKHMEKQHA